MISFPPPVNILSAPTDPMDSFQSTLKLAFAAHNAGRHADAEAMCRPLLQLNPADAQLLFLFGMILHKTSRDVEAAVGCAAPPNFSRIPRGFSAASAARVAVWVTRREPRIVLPAPPNWNRSRPTIFIISASPGTSWINLSAPLPPLNRLWP